MKLNRVNEVHFSNEGLKMTIVTYRTSLSCDVEFEDGYIVYNKQYWDIKRGEVRNPLHKSIYGIGFEGIGKYSRKEHPNAYKRWTALIQRCFDKKWRYRHPHYKDVTVCKEWHNFQVFAEWFEANWKSWMDSSWDLDKDILSKNSKIYSPSTCCFIPKEINGGITKLNKFKGDLPIGISKSNNKFKVIIVIKGKNNYLGSYDTLEKASSVYKEAKNKYILNLITPYKEQLDVKVYKKLINILKK